MLVRNVEHLTCEQQRAFLNWLGGVGYTARVITSSERSLFPKVAEGEFADALYYRINTVTVKLTPRSGVAAIDQECFMRESRQGFMNGSPPAAAPATVVLWSNEAVICTCVTHAPERIEVRLMVVGVTIHSQFFPDVQAASQFAIEKMRVYGGR